MYRNIFKVNNINSYYINIIKRKFLSESYKCSDAWNTRLSTPVLKNVNLNLLYIELEQKFSQGKASAIDIDVFTNCSTDASYADETSDLLHKLRLTDETTNTLESTGHAVIRNFFENNQIDQLINILDDRLSYGVFLDYFTANILLDHFIKIQDFKSAARISSNLMLQEELDHPITTALALYSCFKYLQSPESFYKIEEPEPETNKKKSKKDEIKVRVKFLRNEFFDDHFDLKNNLHLVGKTLIMLGNQVDSTIGIGVKLLGYSLYEKFNEANTLLDSIVSDKKSIFENVINQIKHNLKSNENAKDFLERLENIEQTVILNKQDFESLLLDMVKKSVAANELTDIEKQKVIYSQWIDERAKRLDEELYRLNQAKRLKEIEAISKELEEEGRKLWFFENEEQLDLDIEKKKVVYPKRWFGKKKKARVVDEGYIPPEIVKQRK